MLRFYILFFFILSHLLDSKLMCSKLYVYIGIIVLENVVVLHRYATQQALLVLETLDKSKALLICHSQYIRSAIRTYLSSKLINCIV